jgi:CxxC motif-containing protein (DUF1111 family)
MNLKLLAPLVLLSSLAQAADDPLGEKTGGDTTVYATGRNAFSFPAANLTDVEQTRFVIGNSFFKRNWVQATASGPISLRSCGGCHVNDGRGAPPHGNEQAVGLLLRLSIPGGGAHVGVDVANPLPEPTYGDQFNNAAVRGVKPEGKAHISHSERKGVFADGTPYRLQQPH